MHFFCGLCYSKYSYEKQLEGIMKNSIKNDKNNINKIIMKFDDIDFNAIERAERKALENPYVKEGEKQPKRPHKHKTLQGKIDQTEIDIVLLIDKFRCKTYADCLSNAQILIRLMTLYVLRNKGNISTPEGEKISDKKFTKMC